MKADEVNKIISITKELGEKIDNACDSRGSHVETLDKLWTHPEKGHVLSNIHNVCIVLENDPKYKDLVFHEHAQRHLLDGERIEDKHVMLVRRDLYVRYGINIKKGEVLDCIRFIAADRIYDPIKDYLDALVWDGEMRIPNFLRDVFNAEVTEDSEALIQRMGHNWLVSCVARIYNPGCKVDTAFGCVSDKGYNKGKAFEALAGIDWFTNSDLDFNSERALQKIHQSGKWIWELAEMKAFQGSTAESAKSFMTTQRDIYKIPYATNPVECKRRVVFCFSTNNFQFLTDGAERRFYIITLTDHIDVEYIKKHRDQIWAEAVYYYKQGNKWWFERETYTDDNGDSYVIDWERVNARYQINYLVEDAWAADIFEYFEQQENSQRKITTNDLYDHLNIPQVQRKQGYSIRIGNVCRSLGYKQTKSRNWVKIKQ